MNADIFKRIEEMNKTAFDSAQKLGDINSRAFAGIAECQLHTLGEWVEAGVKHFETASKANDLETWMGCQSAAYSDMARTVAERTAELGGIVKGAQAEWSSWIEEGLKDAKTVAARPRKKTA